MFIYAIIKHVDIYLHSAEYSRLYKDEMNAVPYSAGAQTPAERR
jgi:hypothetical protein